MSGRSHPSSPAPDGVLLAESAPVAARSGEPVTVRVSVPAVSPRRWIRRRVVAAAAILAAAALAVHAGVGWALAEHPLWALSTAGVLVLSSLTLALFVPPAGAGWRPEVGCAPCAAVGAVLAVAAPLIAVSNAFDPGWAAIALLLGSMAFTRKVTEPSACQ